MATPEQRYEHMLDALKGWPSPYALDKSNELTLGEGLIAGMVGHIDASTKKIKRGLPGNQMPLFMWVKEGDYDAVGVPDYNFNNYGNKKGLMGLVATGSYELTTTEYVAGETYNPNTPLTVENTTPADDIGKVKPGVFYTDTVVGVVSDGLITSGNGISTLAFWSYFLPSIPS